MGPKLVAAPGRVKRFCGSLGLGHARSVLPVLLIHRGLAAGIVLLPLEAELLGLSASSTETWSRFFTLWSADGARAVAGTSLAITPLIRMRKRPAWGWPMLGTMIKSFTLGTLVGTVVVWVWGDRLRESFDERTQELRGTLIEWLDVVEDVLGSVRERLDTGLSGTASEPRPSQPLRPAVGE
jgi:hypothetical protein